jgi:hypothetical protein
MRPRHKRTSLAESHPTRARQFVTLCGDAGVMRNFPMNQGVGDRACADDFVFFRLD